MYPTSSNPDEWTPEQRLAAYSKMMQETRHGRVHPLQYGQLSQFPARSKDPLEKKAKIQDWITRMEQIEKEMAEECNLGQAQTVFSTRPRSMAEAALRLASYIGKIEDGQEKESSRNF